MIIYIEDNYNNQRLFERILSKRDYEVESYTVPQEGFQAILRKRPKLIFLDVHLKARITGVDLVKQLREANITAPIIMVTAFNMLADRKQALEAGCNDYLSKPYQIQELLAIVDKYYPATASK